MGILTFRPTSVASRDKVSSDWINELSDNIRNDIREMYRTSTLQISRVNYLLDIISAMDFSISKAIDSISRSTVDESTVLLAAEDYTKMIYPSSIQEIHRAYVDRSYKVITLNRIVEENQVVKDGEIRRDVIIERASNNNLFLQSAESIVESDYRSIFSGNDPYVIKFSNPTPLEKANVNFTIESGTRRMAFNTIRVQPVPSFYNSILGRLVLRDGSASVNLTDSNGDLIELETISQTMRSLPLYIPIARTECNSVYFSFDTYNYIPSENSSIIGLGHIGIDYINYSSRSYIGFIVNVPTGHTILKSVDLYSNEIGLDLSEVKWKLYDNLDDFDEMNDNYVVSSETTIDETSGYRGINSEQLYLLLHLEETELDSTPVIKSIEIIFEEDS